jgi:small-conductance mechanosensitive channel
MIRALRSLAEQNSPAEYLTALAVLVAGAIVVTLLRRRSLVLRFFRSRAEGGDDRLASFVVDQYVHTLIPLAYAAVVYAAVASLALSHGLRHGLNLAVGAVVVLAIFRFLARLAVFSMERFVGTREAEREGTGRSIRALVPVVEIAIWTVGLVFLIENLGFHIEAIVAGLGIGGVAVALAGQSLLKDVFGYVAIVLDRPFELGDTIQTDTFMGTVEYVGLRTTHLRSVGGEQLVFANSDLTAARIRNWKRMTERRVLFQFAVAATTPATVLAQIPEIVRSSVAEGGATRFERATLFAFADTGLVFDVVYYVLSRDQGDYMAAQHRINLAIKQAFERSRIALASAPAAAGSAAATSTLTEVADAERAAAEETAARVEGI